MADGTNRLLEAEGGCFVAGYAGLAKLEEEEEAAEEEEAFLEAA